MKNPEVPVKKLNRNEDGLVAIVITMIIMIVLTLIVVGFAQLARREQRASLDRQLATQAFYAAESGINDGRRLLQTPAYLNTDLSKDTCGPNPGSNLDGNTTQYSCLLIKQTLSDLIFQNVQTNKSLITPIFPDPTPAATFSKLTISWQNTSGANNISAATGFPPGDTWGADNVGILRIDLVPSANISASSLRSGVFTAFLRPKAGSYSATDGTVAYSTAPGDQGKNVNARCDGDAVHAKRKCYVTVTGLSARYYLRMKAIYNPADTDICADDYGCDGTVRLKGAQSEIDSTGRANDVLKRLKVRITKDPDYNGSRTVPEFSVDSSDSVCKVYSVYPGSGTADTCP